MWHIYIMAERCFNNGTPKKYASDRTNILTSQTVFFHNKTRFQNGFSNNFDKTICYDRVNNTVKKVSNYSTLLSLNYGQHLCDDCSGTSGSSRNVDDKLIDTPWNENTTMSGPSNVVDESCNVIENIPCNQDISTEDGGGTVYRGLPAPGIASFIDPSNTIMGNMDDCDRKQYLHNVTTSGPDLLGNTNEANYLWNFQFPSKINLNP